MELLYVFEESGVGCGKHPDPDCLCDVVPDPAGVPIRTIPRLAPFPAHLDSPALGFILWGSMTLGRFEALSGINETTLNEALSLWEGHSDSKARTGPQRIHAASLCLKAGLTFEQTARWLSTTTLEIMDLFYPRDRHELILEMEKHIRAGKTAKQVAEATGCVQTYAGDVARRWGVKMPHSGIRYPAELRQKAIRMVKAGKSRRAVGRELGVSESRVTTWCRHLPTLRDGSPR